MNELSVLNTNITTVAAVIWPTAGIVIPTSLPSASSIDDATQTYVQRMSFFDSAGELIAFEYYATASGDVTFAVSSTSQFTTDKNNNVPLLPYF